MQLDYSYGTTQNNGNVLSQTITVPTVGSNNGFVAVQTYNYDPLNRLKDSTEMSTPNGGSASQSWKQEFSYDRYGNRSFVTGTGHTDTLGSCTTMCNPSFNTSNNRINSAGYSFDSAGNTTADPSGQVFTYDGENKQVLVTNASGTVGQYWYDGDGKRIKKYVPATGETTVFVYDAAGKEIAEYFTIVASSTDAKVNYLTADHLGSPRINTDQNGAVIARHDYRPFGEEIGNIGGRNNGGDTVRKQFTGYERDGETQLDFAQARYSSFVLGRFTSPDPLAASANAIRPQTWNRYSYSLNNPLRFIDPTGMSPGDYLEDGSGKRIGSDGVSDGKYYVVTDKNQIKQISKTDKTGGFTPLSSVSSAIDITSGNAATRQAISDAVDRSNNPAGSDTKGKFHEEAVTIGPDSNGMPTPVASQPGAVSNPLKDPHAEVAPSNFANSSQAGVLQDVTTIAHIHPAGVVEQAIKPPPSSTIQTTVGNDRSSRAGFVQPPSQTDINIAQAFPGKTMIVVGAGNNTVYFYRGSGNRADCNCVASIPLDVFRKLK